MSKSGMCQLWADALTASVQLTVILSAVTGTLRRSHDERSLPRAWQPVGLQPRKLLQVKSETGPRKQRARGHPRKSQATPDW